MKLENQEGLKFGRKLADEWASFTRALKASSIKIEEDPNSLVWFSNPIGRQYIVK
jgi:hypothetical protein